MLLTEIIGRGKENIVSIFPTSLNLRIMVICLKLVKIKIS